jgi:hypothetical protein
MLWKKPNFRQDSLIRQAEQVVVVALRAEGHAGAPLREFARASGK